MFLLAAATLLTVQTAPAPKRVNIHIPSGACRTGVNGRPMSLARFRSTAQGWRATQPEVHFQPSRRASYACVDRVLGIIKDAKLTKLGFVGNMRPMGASQ